MSFLNKLLTLHPQSHTPGGGVAGGPTREASVSVGVGQAVDEQDGGRCEGAMLSQHVVLQLCLPLPPRQLVTPDICTYNSFKLLKCIHK